MKLSILVMTQNMTMQNPMTGREGDGGDGGDDDVGTNTTATMLFRPPRRVQPCPAVTKTMTTGALFIYLFYQHLSIDYVYMTAGTGREGKGPRFIDGTQQVDHQQYVFFSFVSFLITNLF